MQAAQQRQEYAMGQVLYMAIELSNRQWKLGLSAGGKVRRRTIYAGNVEVRSCYEAGRDGFWFNRWLRSQGVANEVVDSASIEVSRRARQAKTDRLDVEKPARLLLRYHGGGAPGATLSAGAERDGRRSAVAAPGAVTEGTHAASHAKPIGRSGVWVPIRGDFAWQVERLRVWDGSYLQAELLRG